MPPQETPKTNCWDLGESVTGGLVSNKYPPDIPNFHCWLWLEAGYFVLGLGCDSVQPPRTFTWLSSLLDSLQRLLFMNISRRLLKKLLSTRVFAAVGAGLEHAGISTAWFFLLIEICWVKGRFPPFLSFLLLSFGSPVLPVSRKTALIAV